MNPGIQANLILLSLFILIWSGWFQTFIKGIGPAGLIKRYILFTYLFLFVDLPITPEWHMNIGGFLFPLIGYIALFIKEERAEKISLIIATLLLGASFFLIKELIHLDPVLIIIDQSYQLALFLLIMVFVIASNTAHRILLLFGGVLLGDVLFYLRHLESVPVVFLGKGETRDILWLSILQLAILQSIISITLTWLKKKKINLLRVR